eukprot:m.11417 g.11417  ORF g.11417 m.11417 type:complete len:405 (+) comp4438_c0_seq1:278-1492(+)
MADSNRKRKRTNEDMEAMCEHQHQPSASKEKARCNAMLEIRSFGKKKGIENALFEKWYFTWLLYAGLPNTEFSSDKDPVFPLNSNNRFSVEVAEKMETVLISNISGSKTKAELVAKALSNKTLKVCTKLRKALSDRKHKKEKSDSTSKVSVQYDEEKEQYCIIFENMSLNVNKTHWDILLSRYNGDLSDVDTLHERLFCLLCRYKTLGGGGYQCALPPAIWNLWQSSSLGVTVEGFASPLNRTLATYHSAYEDIDKYFGSQGSIFKLLQSENLQGSIALNPPYVLGYYEEMTANVVAALERAESAQEPRTLSFVIVVGANDAAKKQTWFNTLQSSSFCRKYLHLRIQDHAFVEGRQHMKKGGKQKLVSVCDTGIFFMQTAKASTTWPISDKLLKKITKLWKTTV